jgi:hypothetical protein
MSESLIFDRSSIIFIIPETHIVTLLASTSTRTSQVGKRIEEDLFTADWKLALSIDNYGGIGKLVLLQVQ